MEFVEKETPDFGALYKKSGPFIAKVIENKRLTPDSIESEVRHLTVDLEGSDLNYIEGQSVGILPPGERSPGQPHRIRLYSVSSARAGDDGSRTTVSLCIKRVVYRDEETGMIVKGVASNHICDLQEGDSINVTGPIGRKFLLPTDNKVDLIMVAVGTGIAPFRAFIHHIYRDRGGWKGKCRLFYGARTGLETLYQNDENNDIGQYYTDETFKAFSAISAEEKTESGKRLYVQDRIKEQKEEIWSTIKNGNFCFYICGLNGMEKGVESAFDQWAREDGLDWQEMKEKFKREGRWVIEVY